MSFLLLRLRAELRWSRRVGLPVFADSTDSAIVACHLAVTMNEATKRGRLVRFSVFEVDLDSGELFKQGRKVKLQGQPFELLLALLERPGAVITREELKQKVWPSNTFVDFDHGLNRAINKVRDALGDSADSPRFIETVPRRGYRFIGSVNGAGQPQVAEAKPTRGLRSLVLPVAFGLLAIVGITAVLLGLNVH